MKIQSNSPSFAVRNLPINTRENQPPQDKVDLKNSDPQPPGKPWGKALIGGAVYAGGGALLGAGMAQGGAGGLVCGALAGATVGAMTIARLGDGKGADGLVYAAAGLAAGAIAGGILGVTGLSNGALITGATMGILKAGRVLADA